MPLQLPLVDPFIDGLTPLYPPGQACLSQRLLEQAVEKDFPEVAVLGFPVYAERLTRMVYTTGCQAFYLDLSDHRPGHLVVFIEEWTTPVDAEGELSINMKSFTGGQGAKRAEMALRQLVEVPQF